MRPRHRKPSLRDVQRALSELDLLWRPPGAPEKGKPESPAGDNQAEGNQTKTTYSAANCSTKDNITKSVAVQFYTDNVLPLEAVQIMFDKRPQWRSA